ncbi:phenylalanine-4-hydroxylase [Variovorax guangxiensis]|nr:phenylalanine-4-hydroxylase [Variovorax guangxiensis]
MPGLIPELPFFTLLANRKFPVTDWIRKPEEFDYIVEPDVFHDLFGHSELRHAVRSEEPLRLPLDLLRAMRTRYKIDTYQANYFVIDSFAQLFEMTAPDFTPVYEAIATRPDIEPGVLLPGESSL